MGKKGPPLFEVRNAAGRTVPTLYPAVEKSRAEIVLRHLRGEPALLDRADPLEARADREMASAFDVDAALKEAEAAREAMKS